MDEGSAEIGRRIGARAAGVAFAVTYLGANLSGAGATAGLERGILTALIVWFAASLLSKPAVEAVLDALARDQAKRQAAQQEADA